MTQHEQIFQKFRESLIDQLEEHVEKVILFGSVARGDQTEESDIDVLIIVNSAEGKEQIFDISYSLMLESDIYISPKVLTEEEFENIQETSFMKNISEEMEEYAEA